VEFGADSRPTFNSGQHAITSDGGSRERDPWHISPGPRCWPSRWPTGCPRRRSRAVDRAKGVPDSVPRGCRFRRFPVFHAARSTPAGGTDRRREDLRQTRTISQTAAFPTSAVFFWVAKCGVPWRQRGGIFLEMRSFWNGFSVLYKAGATAPIKGVPGPAWTHTADVCTCRSQAVNPSCAFAHGIVPALLTFTRE